MSGNVCVNAYAAQLIALHSYLFLAIIPTTLRHLKTLRTLFLRVKLNVFSNRVNSAGIKRWARNSSCKEQNDLIISLSIEAAMNQVLVKNCHDM